MNTPVSSLEIFKKFPTLFLERFGPEHGSLVQASTPELAETGHLVFVTNLQFLKKALEGLASCLVIPPNLKNEFAIGDYPTKSILVSKNVKLAMALVVKEFFAPEKPLQPIGTIHPTAVIDPSAKMGKNVSVGPYTIIGPNVSIADDVRIDAHVVIEADSVIQKSSHLYSHLYIGPRTEIGERCELLPHSTIGAEGFGFAPNESGHFFRVPQIGKVIIENDVEVGSHTTIDRATFGVTRIGEGTKIDKQAHIAHNCEIGKHCVLAGSFAVAGSTKIGNHFISGGRVTVKDNITITDFVEIAGLSAVHGSILESGKYGGHPTLPIRDSMRTIMSLPHVPKLRKDVTKILKHLNLESED